MAKHFGNVVRRHQRSMGHACCSSCAQGLPCQKNASMDSSDQVAGAPSYEDQLNQLAATQGSPDMCEWNMVRPDCWGPGVQGNGYAPNAHAVQQSGPWDDSSASMTWEDGGVVVSGPRGNADQVCTPPGNQYLSQNGGQLPSNPGGVPTRGASQSSTPGIADVIGHIAKAITSIVSPQPLNAQQQAAVPTTVAAPVATASTGTGTALVVAPGSLVSAVPQVSVPTISPGQISGVTGPSNNPFEMGVPTTAASPSGMMGFGDVAAEPIFVTGTPVVGQAVPVPVSPPSAVIGDLTFASLVPNETVSVDLVPGGTAGQEAVTETNVGGVTQINVTINSGASTAAQIVAAINAYNSANPTQAVVQASVSGTASNPQMSPAAAIPLVQGANSLVTASNVAAALSTVGASPSTINEATSLVQSAQNSGNPWLNPLFLIAAGVALFASWD